MPEKEKSKEHIKEYNKQYYKDNKEYLLEHAKQYNKDHKEQRKEYTNQWRKNNPKKVQNREYQKQWEKDHKERRKKQNKQWYKDHPEYKKQYRKIPKNRFIVYKYSAKRKGFIFNITLSEFLDIISQPCYYCGGEGYGIDRLDNSIGYLKGNIVSCCSICNFMKNKFPKDIFIEQCKKISDNWDIKE